MCCSVLLFVCFREFFCGLVANRIKGVFFYLLFCFGNKLLRGPILMGLIVFQSCGDSIIETLIMVEVYRQRMVGVSSNSIVFDQDNITVGTSVMLLVVAHTVAASIGLGTETVLFLEILVTYAVMCLR